MSDEMDRTQAHEEAMRAAALAEHARRAPPASQDSAHTCAGCGLSIPELRRAALPGVQTCVVCQTDIEQSVDKFNRVFRGD